jgi:hypothetical protein
MDEIDKAKSLILQPMRVWSRDEVLSKPSPVPASPGVYGWFFRSLPAPIETAECIKYQDLTLLYVGISPKKPPAVGTPSGQTLRSRTRYHYRGNAAGSTLRLTLGSLLADVLGIELRRVGSGQRLTFSAGEALLSDWMSLNAFVCWSDTDEPWLAEEALIKTVDLPLNLDQNSHHLFHATLKATRAAQRTRAKELPVLSK